MSQLIKRMNGGIPLLKIENELSSELRDLINNEESIEVDLSSFCVESLSVLDEVARITRGVTLGGEGKVSDRIWSLIEGVEFLSVGDEVDVRDFDFSDFRSLRELVIVTDLIGPDVLYSCQSCVRLSVIESAALNNVDLRKMSRLTSLYLDSVKAKDLPVDYGWSKLKSFTCYNYRDIALVFPEVLNGLEKLYLSRVKVDWAQTLPVMPKLRDLSVQACPSLPDLSTLGAFQMLESFYLEAKGEIFGLSSLRGCSSLRKLILSGCKFAEDDLSWLCDFKLMEYLKYVDRKEYEPKQKEIYEALILYPNGEKSPPRRGVNFALQPKRWWEHSEGN